MYEIHTTASLPCDVIGIDLHTIWDVNADETYNIRHDFSIETSRSLHRLGGKGWIALRTLSGKGCIECNDQKTTYLKQNTLFLTQWDSLRRYYSSQEGWRFWWFEFTTTGAMPAPADTVLTIDPIDSEQKWFEQTCSLLRSTQQTHCRLAACRVLEMLYRWLANSDVVEHTSIYRKDIEKVIDLMHHRLADPLTVQEMAQTVNMSERTFRNAFNDVTGESPKQFYNQLRLSIAKQFLLCRQYTLTQIADRLGYSSSFHFSREFKRYYGVPPSKFTYEDDNKQ